jgi:hypothetical protein
LSGKFGANDAKTAGEKLNRTAVGQARQGGFVVPIRYELSKQQLKKCPRTVLNAFAGMTDEELTFGMTRAACLSVDDEGKLIVAAAAQ